VGGQKALLDPPLLKVGGQRTPLTPCFRGLWLHSCIPLPTMVWPIHNLWPHIVTAVGVGRTDFIKYVTNLLQSDSRWTQVSGSEDRTRRRCRSSGTDRPPRLRGTEIARSSSHRAERREPTSPPTGCTFGMSESTPITHATPTWHTVIRK